MNSLPEYFLRAIISLLMIIHGIARITFEIVDEFGVFLGESGFPLGGLIAWGITLGEIIFGIIIISGYYVRYAVVFFIINLLAGLIMVHIHEGWFVVGIGRNGMEYSVLLITVFGYLGWKDFINRRNKSE